MTGATLEVSSKAHLLGRVNPRVEGQPCRLNPAVSQRAAVAVVVRMEQNKLQSSLSDFSLQRAIFGGISFYLKKKKIPTTFSTETRGLQGHSRHSLVALSPALVAFNTCAGEEVELGAAAGSRSSQMLTKGNGEEGALRSTDL